MWAFIPASANCSGAILCRDRASKRGLHALGAPPGSSTAAKNRSANTTSSRVTNAGSANATPWSRAFTPSVTAR